MEGFELMRQQESALKADLSSLVETFESGCPICEGLVKGNDKYLFFCKSCNMLFQRKHLKMRKERLKAV
ncbi:MAG: hypothetical protein V1743_02155 [Nanoarchaeota archaeon]